MPHGGKKLTFSAPLTIFLNFKKKSILFWTGRIQYNSCIWGE